MFEKDVVLFKTKKQTAGLRVLSIERKPLEEKDFSLEIPQNEMKDDLFSLPKKSELSFEIIFTDGKPHIMANLFSETPTEDETIIQIENEFSRLTQLIHQHLPSLCVKPVKGEKLKEHFLRIFGGEIIDFDVDRGELFLLSDEGGRYSSISILKPNTRSPCDFDILLEAVLSTLAADPCESTFILPFRWKSQSKSETSPYIVHLAKRQGGIGESRRSFASTIQKKVAIVNKKVNIQTLGGSSLIRSLGGIYTRGVLRKSYPLSFEKSLLIFYLLGQRLDEVHIKNIQLSHYHIVPENFDLSRFSNKENSL